MKKIKYECKYAEPYNFDLFLIFCIKDKYLALLNSHLYYNKSLSVLKWDIDNIDTSKKSKKIKNKQRSKYPSILFNLEKKINFY